MAYMSQEHKAELAPSIKKVLKKYGMQGSIAVRHYSTLVVNIKSGKLDFLKERNNTYIQVNPYHIDSNYKGLQRDFLLELRKAMMSGNHDNSDVMTDYFDVGWYIDINIGKWNKPYIFTGETI